MKGDLALSAVFGTLFLFALYELAFYRWQVAIAPGLAAGTGLLLIGLIVRRLAVHGAQDAPKTGAFRRADLAAILSFIVALACVILLGFAIGGAVYVFVQVAGTRTGPRRIPVALACAAMVPLTVIGFFEYTLEIRLFTGLLLP